MNRRRLIAALTLSLIATLVAAPMAFQVGLANGRNAFGAEFAEPFDLASRAGPVAGKADFWDCDQPIRLPAVRVFDRVQDCRPESGRGVAAYVFPAGIDALADHAAVAPKAKRRQGQLNRAVAATIAGAGPQASAQAPAEAPLQGNPGTPFSLAMAPAAAGALGPPSLGGEPGLPGVLIPNGFLGQFIPAPVDPSGPPETGLTEVPLPAALPILLTGVLGLGFASRRGRRANRA